MNVTIDKNIPIPGRQWRNTFYPWKELEIGDSFLMPGMKAKTAASQASAAAKKYGVRFTVRQIGDDARVWRIA